MKKEIYNIVLDELKKMMLWFSNPSYKQDFELDEVYSSIYNKYHVNFRYGILYHILILTEMIYYRTDHDEKELATGYSVDAGIKDLQEVITMIETDRIEDLENNVQLKRRIIKIALDR